jgi:hypothetical protein
MGDSALSASELRNKYANAPDSDLSAAQLRARYAIPGNSRDFASRPVAGGDGSVGVSGSIVATLLLITVAVVAYYVYTHPFLQTVSHHDTSEL